MDEVRAMNKQEYLLKRLSLFGIVLSAIQIVVFYLFVEDPFLTFLCAFLVLVFSSVYALSAHKKLFIAKQFYFHLSLFSIYLFEYKLKGDMGILLYYLPVGLLLFILYRFPKDKNWIIIHCLEIVVGIIFKYFFIDNSIDTSASDSLYQQLYVLNFLSAFILTAFVGYFLVKAGNISEKKLIESQAKLNAMFDSSVEAIFLVDRNNKLIWFNKKALEEVKEAFSRELKMDELIFDYVPLSLVEVYKLNLSKAFLGELVDYERELIASDGTKQYYSINFLPVYDANDVIIGVAAKGLNITKQKQKRENEIAIIKLRKEVIKNQLKQKNLGLIIHGQELERQKLAEELHSGLAQSAAVLRMLVSGLDLLQTDNLKNTELQIKEVIDSIDKEVKRISNALMPGSLIDLGLIEGLQSFFSSASIINFNYDLFVKNHDWSQKQKISIYRIVQEGVIKALRSETLTGIDVQFVYNENDHFLLEMNFYGLGEENSKFEWVGLNDIEHRAELIHAEFEVFAYKDSDTKITLKIPVRGHIK